MKTIFKTLEFLVLIVLVLCAYPQNALSQDNDKAIELMSDTSNAKRVRSAIALTNKVKQLGHYIKKLDEIISPTKNLLFISLPILKHLKILLLKYPQNSILASRVLMILYLQWKTSFAI